MSELELVEIVWSDAAHIQPGDWVTELPATTAVTVTSIGVLLRETSDHVLLAQSLDDSGNATGVFSIPTANIVGRRNLRPAT